MGNKNKKIDEISTAAGENMQMPAVGNISKNVKADKMFKVRRNRSSKDSSAPFSERVIHMDMDTGTAKVFSKNKKNKKRSSKIAKLETKSERMLRESIRNLVFLSRVKYHEEQALREMQEQKLRNVIRFLINEGNEQSVMYSSTGETAGASFIEKITVTLKQYAALVSTQAQRDEFKKIYLTGIKNYLDALDEQYYILNPEERPGSVQQQPAQQVAAPLQEAPVTPPPINSPKVNAISGLDNKNMVSQATAAAIQTVGVKNKTGHGAAEEALNRDLPQIDPLYNNLTFEQFTVANAKGLTRTTNDRKDFRIMLIGDSQTNDLGNIANEFIKIDIAKQTNDSPHKNDPTNTPALERKPQAGATPATPTGQENNPPLSATQEQQPELPSGAEEEETV